MSIQGRRLFRTGSSVASNQPEPTAFTVAVIPDTQQEVAGNPQTGRFATRTRWLVDNKDSLNLKFVAHTGDIVNWGWLEQSQFDVATASMQRLDGNVPYTIAPGNHDTRAVGTGGGAYVSQNGGQDCIDRFGVALCKTGLLVRRTEEFNTAFPLSNMQNVGGAFEANKSDNVWSTFSAGGKQWLMLSLEMWPRSEVVTWANSVVSSHPNHNVLVSTHYFLDAGGAISSDNGYGSGLDPATTNSAQYLYDNLIRQHANIRFVFSGHVGNSASRVDTGINGNKIVSILGCFHSNTENPVRLLQIDTAANTASSYVYSSWTSTDMGYTTSHNQLNFV